MTDNRDELKHDAETVARHVGYQAALQAIWRMLRQCPVRDIDEATEIVMSYVPPYTYSRLGQELNELLAK